jgi:hypothetical protein
LKFLVLKNENIKGAVMLKPKLFMHGEAVRFVEIYLLNPLWTNRGHKNGLKLSVVKNMDNIVLDCRTFLKN